MSGEMKSCYIRCCDKSTTKMPNDCKFVDIKKHVTLSYSENIFYDICVCGGTQLC